MKPGAQVRTALALDLRPCEVDANVITRTIVIGDVELREQCIDGSTVAGRNELGEARPIRGEVWVRHAATMRARRRLASDRARQAGDPENAS